MLIKLRMYNTNIKPIIKVKIVCGEKTIDTYALIDTGSSKPVWVGSEKSLKLVSKHHISSEGVLSGFGLHPQTNCAIKSIDICLRDEKVGIMFRDLHVICANLNTGGLFSLVLPFTMFNKFDFGSQNILDDADFGFFIVDTHSSQINYHLIDNNGMITDVLTDSDCNQEVREITAF